MSTYVITPTVEQEKLMQAFLEEQHIDFFKEEEDLPQHVLDGISKAQANIAAGNFITHDEFKKRIGLS
jgi:predicted transcriptional regulator